MDVAAFIKSFQSRAAAPLPPQSIGELIDNVRRQVKGEGGPEGGGPLADSLIRTAAEEKLELVELLDEGLVSGRLLVHPGMWNRGSQLQHICCCWDCGTSASGAA